MKGILSVAWICISSVGAAAASHFVLSPDCKISAFDQPRSIETAPHSPLNQEETIGRYSLDANPLWPALSVLPKRLSPRISFQLFAGLNSK
jgi:hypothetical protein